MIYHHRSSLYIPYTIIHFHILTLSHLDYPTLLDDNRPPKQNQDVDHQRLFTNPSKCPLQLSRPRSPLPSSSYWLSCSSRCPPVPRTRSQMLTFAECDVMQVLISASIKWASPLRSCHPVYILRSVQVLNNRTIRTTTRTMRGRSASLLLLVLVLVHTLRLEPFSHDLGYLSHIPSTRQNDIPYHV